MTSEVRKCPKWGFWAVYRPPRTPYGRRKSGIFIFCVEFQGGQHIKKSATRTGAKRVNFWKNMFFWTFRDFFEYIAFQSISQSFMRQKRRAPIFIDQQGVAGNNRVLIFLSSYQVDELRNQKCGTHIKTLTAMKFRYWEKVSYHSTRLGKTYVEKNKDWVNV